MIFSGIFSSITSYGLVSSYNFSQSAGTYTAITGGALLGDTTNDDDNFQALDIGFTFYFNGQAYTQFGINANGYLVFGNLNASSHTVLSSGNNNNVVSAMNFDLEAHTGSELRYQTTGAAPNRTLVIQWSNYQAYNETGDTLNFQIRISETINHVTVRYGKCVVITDHTAQIGLRGANNADFNNRYVSDTVNIWATSQAGTANNSNCLITSVFRPASGQTYAWTPDSPPAPPGTFTVTNVTTTGFTINWIDVSSVETGFLVYRSTDNVNFTLINTVASTSTATTGTPYSLPQNGLASGTTLYYRIYSIGNIPSTTYLSGNGSTLNGTLCGTYKVGPTGDYTSLKGAISDLQANGLSCDVIVEFQAAYVSTVDTFPVTIPFLGSNSSRKLTIRPENGATNIQLTGDTTRIIDLNGATWVTIDGRAGGTGSVNNLSIIDSSTSGNAIRFINDAQNNTVTYVDIMGATKGSTTNGVIAFGNSATMAGNSDNTLSFCEISYSDSFPQVLIYSNTNTGTNSSNTIINNKLHDWYATGGSNYAINLGANNAEWTISDNSFYQANTQTFTTGNTNTIAAINIAGTGGPGGGASGNGFIISGNFIGGSQPNCGGSAWTTNSSGNTRFNGISINAGITTASEIQGNKIQNIIFSTAATAGGGPGGGNATVFNGINIAGGNVNVGTTSGNTIGNNTANNNIQTIASANGSQTVGINTSSSGSVTISNNIIGGIFANDSAALNTTSLIGILASNGTVVISNNSIGSATQNGSIKNATTSATGNNQVTGISCTNINSGSITGNVIQNLTNFYEGISFGTVRGISVSAGTNTIGQNVIESLSGSSPQTGNGANAAVAGIIQTSTQSGQVIEKNIIRALTSKTAEGNITINGIYSAGSSTAGNVIRKNRIYGLSAPSDTSVSTINGIHINGGKSVVHNNIICLGSDTTGASYPAANEYNGILKSSATDNSFYFNSVNITGTSVDSRVVNTYCFRRTSTGIDTLRNNIFANTRSNASTGGNHYSISMNNDTTISSDKNDLFGNGTGYVTGQLNGINKNSLFDWFSACHVDSGSLAVNPNFISANNLHINTATPSGLESKGSTITGIADDIDNDVRPGPAGSVNGGGTAPDIGADEFDGTLILLDMGVYALYRPTNGCHSANDSVSITIKNYSTQTINFTTNNLTLTVSSTGTNPVTFPVVTLNSGTLAAGATRNVLITNSYNMSAAGSYVFHALATTSGDIINSNDSIPPVTISISGGTASPASSSICAGLPVTLSVSGQTPGSTLQWQSSTNQVTWNNISGATSSTVTVSPGVKTYYRAVGCGLFFSTVDTVNVASVAVPTGVTGGTRCGAGAISLHANSSNTILWYDSASNGNILDTGAVFNTTVTSTRAFYAAANGNISAPKTLSTIISGPNNSGGIMFTISAISNVNVTGFDCQAGTGTNTWNIYYRRDDFLNVPGSNQDSSGWIFVDSASGVVSAGTGFLTTIPINMNVLIPAGKTYSFYVLVTSGPNVIYSQGTGLGNINASNSDLQVRDGYAGQTFNCVTPQRVFNGMVRYKTSCISNRVAANVTVTNPPSLNATAASSFVCDGDSVQLHVTSANGNYRYTWAPTADLSDSTGATVYAFPATSSVYFVYAHDSVTNCNNVDSVSVGTYTRPAINITSNNDSICSGDSLLLNVVVPQSYGIGNGFNSNLPNAYPAPYGNFSFGARHQLLIRADEMSGAGMSPGYINSLSFQVTTTNGSGALNNFTIRMANTVKTALTDTFQTGAMSTVYTSAAYTPVNGTNTHSFSTPFHWNGTSNILIETCFNDTNSTANASMRRSNTSFASCTYYNADSANNCSHILGTAVNQRPNIRFGIQNQYSAQWISAQTLSSTTSFNPYSIPTGTDDYYVTITDTITGCTSHDSATIHVDPAPTVFLGNDTTACGQFILDAANPGDTYLWNDSSVNQTFTVDTTGEYYVTVTHLQSCSASDSIQVTINELPAVSLILPFDSLCIDDGSQVLTGGLPANGSFSGNGINGNTLDPMIAGAGVHTVTYTFTDTATTCTGSATDTIVIDICAGIKNRTVDLPFSVYPNPVSKTLTIVFGAINNKCRIDLFSMDAKEINSRTIENAFSYELNLENLPNGIYYLKVSTADKNYVVRVVKAN